VVRSSADGNSLVTLPPSCDHAQVTQPGSLSTVPGVFLLAIAAHVSRSRTRQEVTDDASTELDVMAFATDVAPEEGVPAEAVSGACARALVVTGGYPTAQDFADPQLLGFYAPVLRRHSTCSDGLRALAESLSSGDDAYLSLQVVNTSSQRLEVRVAPQEARHFPQLLAAMGTALVQLYGYSAKVEVNGNEIHLAWYTKPWWASLATGAFLASLLAIALPMPFVFRAACAIALVLLGWRLMTMPSEVSRKSRAAFERGRVLEHAMRAIETRGTAGRHPTLFGGRYRVEGVLGSGATSIVYRARDLASDEPVAIKALRASSSSDVSSRDRLRREADALSLSWHPNVVECKGYIERGGTPFLVLECIDGELLEALVKTSTLSAKATTELGLTLLNATTAMHGSGVIHRDIKPANILMKKAAPEDGVECTQVKIIDFGIAQIEWEEMRLTGGGSRLGTPLYMPPEHLGAAAQSALGASTILPDRQADLYAIAVTLMECWLGPGVVSSREDRLSELAMRAREGDDAAFAGILARALSPTPEARYADAESFADALKRLNEAEAERQDA
jgi:tRNA A-37 threonylcarbamoyl transferase component Bud32